MVSITGASLSKKLITVSVSSMLGRSSWKKVCDKALNQNSRTLQKATYSFIRAIWRRMIGISTKKKRVLTSYISKAAMIPLKTE